DAVVAISTPATWGVSPRLRARALLLAVHHRVGRHILSARGTRVVGRLAAPPISPSELAPRIAIPVAIVHGGRDPYVPTADAVLLHERLGGVRRLIILPAFGHAEAAYSPGLADLLDGLIGELLSGTPGSEDRTRTGPSAFGDARRQAASAGPMSGAG
ncbi:MAG: uncharacterized protein QOG64_1149, partial [Acidimicrobiaceae bacterium]|nr:uncharacterized protein [Acidimicrobiaceae bacterium]